MVKRRLFGTFMGMFGILLAYQGIVSYLSHPQPDGLFLPLGVLSVFMGVQWFSDVNREARFWMSVALSSVVSTYGLLDLFTRKREEFWAFLIFLGLLSSVLLIFFAVMHAKGYRWRRDGAKTLPPAGEGDEGV